MSRGGRDPRPTRAWRGQLAEALGVENPERLKRVSDRVVALQLAALVARMRLSRAIDSAT